MYIRGIHADATIPALRQLIRDNPLGILTTAIRSETAPFLQSSHIPFVVDVEDDESESELGVLRGHMARQNPQAKALIEAAQALPEASDNVLEDDVLVLFTTTAHHYVTPKFYVETKPSTGKVVPTWNYAAAQVYGKVKVYWDHKSDESIEFLSKQIQDLSQHAEANIMGYQKPWKVTDAPERYIELMRKNIIGFEIRIDRLEGKFKMSQEMGEGDRQGVIQGFQSLDGDSARGVAEMVQQRDALKKAKASST